MQVIVHNIVQKSVQIVVQNLMQKTARVQLVVQKFVQVYLQMLVQNLMQRVVQKKGSDAEMSCRRRADAYAEFRAVVRADNLRARDKMTRWQ